MPLEWSTGYTVRGMGYGVWGVERGARGVGRGVWGVRRRAWGMGRGWWGVRCGPERAALYLPVDEKSSSH